MLQSHAISGEVEGFANKLTITPVRPFGKLARNLVAAVSSIMDLPPASSIAGQTNNHDEDGTNTRD